MLDCKEVRCSKGTMTAPRQNKLTTPPTLTRSQPGIHCGNSVENLAADSHARRSGSFEMPLLQRPNLYVELLG